MYECKYRPLWKSIFPPGKRFGLTNPGTLGWRRMESVLDDQRIHRKRFAVAAFFGAQYSM
ncbi:hypothetical protein BDI4_1010027 [Burkholderia diffusa]|nr:hypothetical protein BDI4_1010027 [Burkholderia diffusa]